MRHWSTRFDIYDSATLHLVVCDNIPLAQLEFKEIKDASYTDDSRGLMVCKWPHFFIFLEVPRGMSHRTIAHEVFHVVTMLMRNVGVKITSKNDEAYAYMIDWVTGWVYWKLGARRIPSGHKKKLDKSSK